MAGGVAAMACGDGPRRRQLRDHLLQRKDGRMQPGRGVGVPSVQVRAGQVAPVVAHEDAVRVEHGHLVRGGVRVWLRLRLRARVMVRVRARG